MTDYEPLEVDMNARDGTGESVALLLQTAAKAMERMPDETRYNVTVQIDEVDA